MSFLAKIDRHLVEADFKTVLTKFVNAGNDKAEVETVLKDFKELKNKNRIQDQALTKGQAQSKRRDET